MLPVTTQWERHSGFLTGNRDILIYHRQITEPLFEAKDDIEIAREVGVRLGLDPMEIDPVPLAQQTYQPAGRRYRDESRRLWQRTAPDHHSR